MMTFYPEHEGLAQRSLSTQFGEEIQDLLWREKRRRLPRLLQLKISPKLQHEAAGRLQKLRCLWRGRTKLKDGGFAAECSTRER
jgi:hypothetical protein